VRLSKDRLRSQYLPDNATCFYVRVTVDGQLAGNAFACRWTVSDKTVCWVTQLVVDRDYRERGLAKGLLNQLKQNDVDIYGLMSSHPAACLAAAKAFGGKHTEALHYGINSKNYRLY
jgi:GNAT superfamily N-acetyltransferase